MNRKAIIYSALAATLGLGTVAATTTAAAAQPDMEKCYGVAKAGHNDCATAHSSCAGTAAQDRLGSAFIVVPKGTCEKIAGGSLEPKG